MPDPDPDDPLRQRYASAEMSRVFSADNRYRQWRRLWIVLAEVQGELGLPISAEQIEALRAAAPRLDLARVAEIERQTRHDVVAHLRHFAEQAGEAGGILHLGATSAFITDNTDQLLMREGLELLVRRLAGAIAELAGFARRYRATPALAYTHLQPAQPTTVGKRACLWIQDLLADLAEVRHRLAHLRLRGAKGTTGTQASFLDLFDGDRERVLELDRRLTERLGFADRYRVTGQTYPRKQDSQVLAALAGIAESAHKLGTDVRLLQGLGELAEPFDDTQVGSSAMPYKRNPVRAERLCALARKLITDSLNGPLTAATQWLERSLDDSANRRLVIPEAFLLADSLLGLAAGIAARLTVREAVVEARLRRELPFMATEALLMRSTLAGADRQKLHERLRVHSLEAHRAVESGEENPLVERLLGDAEFRLSRSEVERILQPAAFVGLAAEQVDEFLRGEVEPALAGVEGLAAEEPRV